MTKSHYDVLIIGSGPAGLSASIYLSRQNISNAFIESTLPGGKIGQTEKVENYPGIEKISGFELATNFLNHAKSYGAKMIFGKVVNFSKTKDNLIEVNLENGDKYFSQALIIATGMKSLVPEEIINIHTFNHRGVSYCAVCDGSLYKNEVCGIIGGGNSAFEEGAFLANVAKEVHIFVRDKIIAEKTIQNQLLEHKNVTIHKPSQIKKLIGKDKLEEIEFEENCKLKHMKMAALFPYIGFKPSTDFISQKEILDPRGFIKVNENMETTIENVYAAGDVIQKQIRQIVTAANDGTIAAKTITNKIISKY
ncbi:thioredoxin reductase (NADPH) [Metamycoplasma subdolum]|uniref:Thioredoxin reductase (NADPH) n=1 Tax=Metamycoplasma subdolum TaxID=92407 RepID=A0A3M0A0M9_9BACT|nr:FAD-dependent oxidoreductase [Metamycoplasma subdolum]RMA78563.1 thioredoxin reductase (NADPH) [Metamycoplasma subdolum]WPB50298.1 FAD-dependent oxidoreductase [Metamycoplasma subdolum]